MRKEVLAGVLGAAVTVSACNAEPEIRTGTVTNKQDIPSRDWIYLMPIPHTMCYSTGKSEECITTFTYIPVPEHDPEHWQVTIQNCEVDPKCKTATFEVTQEVFNQLNVGQNVDWSTPAPTK